MTDNKGVSPVKLVKDFFGMNLAQMKSEWMGLPEKDKAEILAGLQDGTLNY